MPWIAGYPRAKVDWFPSVDLSKCLKCGICMNCGKGVFQWTDQGPIVAKPYECVVGCTTCANLCRGNAISFPKISYVKRLYAREGIWDRVKEAMEDSGKLRPTVNMRGVSR